MPSIFSSIPGLSSLPNPLTLFNADDLFTSSHSPPPSAMQATQTPPLSGHMETDRDTSIADAGTLPSHTLPSSVPSEDRSTPTRPTRKANIPSNVLPDAQGRQTGGRRISSGPSVAPGRPKSNIYESRPSPPTRRRDTLESSISGTNNEAQSIVDGRRRRRPVETYVIVKPPPTSAKNPLNLQVQLVISAKSRGRLPSETPSLQSSSAFSEGLSVPSTPLRSSFESNNETKKDNIVDLGSSSPAELDSANSNIVKPVQPITGLERSSSIQSTSTSHSTISTAVSTNSNVSGTKRIIPLYNLAVHNVVQPTVVTDAGTDSRVAKFLKRSLDINGVGVLEPAEIWLPLSGPLSPRHSDDVDNEVRSARPASMISNSSLLSPAPSRAGDDSKRSSVDFKGFKFDNFLTPHRDSEDGPRKFFGKIFKKRGSMDASVDPRSSKIKSSPSKSFSSIETAPLPGHTRTATVPSPPNQPTVHFKSSPSITEGSQTGHPTFGLSPVVVTRRSSSTFIDASGAIVGLIGVTPALSANSEAMALLPSSRPVGYTWTVRKWAKQNTEGWAAHIVAAAAAGLDFVSGSLPGDGADEVVFEWVKKRAHSTSTVSTAAPRQQMKTKEQVNLTPRKKTKSRSTSSTPHDSNSPSGSQSSLVKRTASPIRPSTTVTEPSPVLPNPGPASFTPNTLDPRPGPVRRASASPSPRRASCVTTLSSDLEGSSSVEEINGTDDGCDSDPEDSETPWTCSVWIRQTGNRQLLATLRPAPHHPKVIGVLEFSNGLDSMSLAEVKPPSTTNVSRVNGTRDLAAKVRREVALTEENLKDVVSVTAMWLVAREEFGGLGKKRRT